MVVLQAALLLPVRVVGQWSQKLQQMDLARLPAWHPIVHRSMRVEMMLRLLDRHRGTEEKCSPTGILSALADPFLQE